MSFKSIFREVREGIGSFGRRGAEGRHLQRCGRSHIAPLGVPFSSALVQQSPWANLPPELLTDIIHRLEASQTSWPARKDVVACAAVCQSWRRITKEVVRTPEQCGLLTFPISLKQPGPRDSTVQCFIRRDRASSTYRLYFGLSPALSGDVSKLLLAAKKIRRATNTDFVISLVGDDYSRASDAYIGKLRSNFLGTKFTIYDTQPSCTHAIQSKGHRRTHLKQVSAKSVGAYVVATISYELNVLRTRGPRRMQCSMHTIPISAIKEGGTAPTPLEFTKCLDEHSSPLRYLKGKSSLVKEICPSNPTEPQVSTHGTRDPLMLKNKTPRWHEQLQCWCLNFKGRVTVASVKNFQLVAALEPSQTVPLSEHEKVLLQFGKIGKDIFTMDYRYPLSAFQAFTICLSSFDTKPACE